VHIRVSLAPHQRLGIIHGPLFFGEDASVPEGLEEDLRYVYGVGRRASAKGVIRGRVYVSMSASDYPKSYQLLEATYMPCGSGDLRGRVSCHPSICCTHLSEVGIGLIAKVKTG
jgi:hypothetical protein